jgi:hypothetical protein
MTNRRPASCPRAQSLDAPGADTRVNGYNGQPVSMPEVDDLRKNLTILLSMLKSLRMPDDEDGVKMTRSQVGQHAAAARWHG